MSGSRPRLSTVERQRWIRTPLSVSGRANFPIVAIGASAGGLEACKKLLDALPERNGMAFVIVQHLDPSHDSMLVDLLAARTSMKVVQATDGMAIERERVYVIPPGVYLAVDEKGILRLSRPLERHGARLPFDFLLNSLAKTFGARVVCVVLSGTGADGSLGLKAVKAKGGLVVAQDLGEADYDGMPRSAIATGEVDLVLAGREDRRRSSQRERARSPFADAGRNRPPADRSRRCCRRSSTSCARRTVHDFTLYKHGTLERRVERRMAMAAIQSRRQLSRISAAQRERTRSALPRLADQRHGLLSRPAGFRFPREERHSRPRARSRSGSTAAGLGRRLQFRRRDLFPRDAACASRSAPRSATSNCRSSPATLTPMRWRVARDGLYPQSIEADVSPSRLAAFFTRDDHSYRVSPELRS